MRAWVTWVLGAIRVAALRPTAGCDAANRSFTGL